MCPSSGLTDPQCGAAGMLNLLRITEENMYDVYRVLNPTKPGDTVADASEVASIAPLTTLGIDADNALALARVLNRTPSGALILNAVAALGEYRNEAMRKLNLSEGQAIYLVDAMCGLVIKQPADAAFLVKVVGLMFSSSTYAHLRAQDKRAFLAKLQGLTPPQCLLVAMTATRAKDLYLCGGISLPDAMRAAGLHR